MRPTVRSGFGLIVILPIAAHAQSPTPRQMDTVSVIGEGRTRQVQRIAPQDAAVLPAGTSPQKLLDRIPGVSVQSNDAYGANEESQSISLRGFGTTQLGYTLDGIPLGNNAYGAFNGLNISRALIAENFAGAELAVGIGNVGTASSSNLGGTVQYWSADPEMEAGGRTVLMAGSNGNRRLYVRADSGEHRGFSGYVSGLDARADMWAAPRLGSRTRQLNAKGVYQDDRIKLTAFVDASETSQANYTYLSRSALGRGLGWDWNLYAPDWPRALAAAYCAPATFDAARCGFSGGVDNVDDAYFKSRALRRDQLYYLGAEVRLSETVDLRAQVYRHNNTGQGHWWAPGQASYPGTRGELPISIRSTNYFIDRRGMLGALSWQWGRHQWEAGFWYERNDHDIERNFYWIDGPIDDDRYLRNPDRRLFRQHYLITTQQFHVQDRFSLFNDRLDVELGAKYLRNRLRATAVRDVENPYASGTLTARGAFLPQAGAAWRLNERQEVFLSYARNMAAFTTGPLSVPQAAFDASRGQLKPETSRTLEAGWRYRDERLQLSAALYQTAFDNRLLSLTPCASIMAGTPGCVTRYFNVGSVRSRGGELTAIWEPVPGLRWYNALSLNDTTYRDDYVRAGAVVPTAGRRVVGIPGRMFASELSWQQGPWSLSLRGKYTGPRYDTYLNERAFGGYTTFDFAASYGFGDMGLLRDLRLSLNVTNLSNKRYAADLSGFADRDPAGRLQSFHASAPRQVFLTLDARF